jgi:hypothetical protein
MLSMSETADKAAESVLNSRLLRALSVAGTVVLTGIALPAGGWGINTLRNVDRAVDRLESSRIEMARQLADTTAHVEKVEMQAAADRR